MSALAITLATGVANAQTYADMHNAGGTITNANGATGADGGDPRAEVTLDPKGNIYGTTYNGGAYGGGVVWRMTRYGVYSDLHDFGSISLDGRYSEAGVTCDAGGDLFGATFVGGRSGDGMIWEITAAGVYKDLHDFGGTVTNANGKSGVDGRNPGAGVSLDSAGNLYGTASMGGPKDSGIVWQITKAGVYHDLHDFGGAVTNANGKAGQDGEVPVSKVSFDSAGNMYGTTSEGGPNTGFAGLGSGTVWEITTAGIYKDRHDFGATITTANGHSGPDGEFPSAGVTFDSSSNMWGTAFAGGLNNFGMVWEITASSAFEDRHDFGGIVTTSNGKSGRDGESPQAGVTCDAAGRAYGATQDGGPTGCGMVWKIYPNAAYADLHDFGGTLTGGADGQYPSCTLTFDRTWNLYGTASEGGLNGKGMVWNLATGIELQGLSLSQAKVIGGSQATGTVTLASAAPSAGIVVQLSSSGAVTAPGEVTIPSGKTSTTFSVTTTAVPTTAAASVTASFGSISKVLTLTVEAPSMTGLSLSTATVSAKSGAAVTGTVTFNGPAPTVGETISLTSSDAAVATVLSSVKLASGATNVTFSVKPLAVTANKAVTISATSGGLTKTAALTVTP